MSLYKIGTVTRPDNGLGNKAVTLTATLSKGSTTGTKTFNLNVIEVGLSDTQSVTKALSNIVLSGISAITGSISLPTTAEYGTTISWSSDKPSVISSIGIVNRPANGAADSAVVLTATVKKGVATESKQFTCTVKPWTDDEEVQVVYNSLTWDSIRNGNPTVDAITGNLTLAATGERNSTVVWTSTNTSAIAANGTVTRPSYTDGDITLSLSAAITVGSASITRQFVGLKVIKLPETNNEAILFAKTALTSEDIKTGNADISNIISNLQLPKKSDGTESSNVTISWAQVKKGTSTPSTYMNIISGSTTDEAVITRPSSAASNEIITLTATLSATNYDGTSKTDTVVFELTIPKSV